MSLQTEAVIQNHLRAATVGVDAVMEDYTEESVLITGEATFRGMNEIRQFFTALLNGVPKGFFEGLTLNRQEFVGEVAYIHWRSDPWCPLATDTFVVKGGKILYQTFAAYTAPAK